MAQVKTANSGVRMGDLSFGEWAATLVANKGEFAIETTDGLVQRIYGTGFDWDTPSGVLKQGTIAVFRLEDLNGNVLLEISDLNMLATDYATMAQPLAYMYEKFFKAALRGRDTIDGGDGKDRLFGYGGADVIRGGLGDDFIEGGYGHDHLIGGAGNDRLHGEQGNDTLRGGSGDDYLLDEAGNDVLAGGRGADKYLFDYDPNALYSASGFDRIVDNGVAGEIDRIEIHNLILSDMALSRSGANLIIGAAGKGQITVANQFGATNQAFRIEEFFFEELGPLTFSLAQGRKGGAGHDIVVGTESADMLWGGGNWDLLFGGAGDDMLFGGAGIDLLNGGPGNDTLTGGDANDIFVFHAGDGRDTIAVSGSTPGDQIYMPDVAHMDDLRFVRNGDDLVIRSVSGGNKIIISNHFSSENPNSVSALVLGADNVQNMSAAYALRTGGDGTDVTNDILVGGSGTDTLNGLGFSDVIFGAAGDDVIDGGDGDDILYGGRGDDTLLGGTGNDRFTGGIGTDVFKFEGAWGRDVITDFEYGVDKIDLRGAGQTWDSLDKFHWGGGYLITSTTGQQILIVGGEPGDLQASDFAF